MSEEHLEKWRLECAGLRARIRWFLDQRSAAGHASGMPMDRALGAASLWLRWAEELANDRYGIGLEETLAPQGAWEEFVESLIIDTLADAGVDVDEEGNTAEEHSADLAIETNGGAS